MLNKIKNAIKNAPKQKRKHLTVEIEIYTKQDKNQFIVAYGILQGRPTNVGTGNTLKKALKDTAETINSPTRQDANTRQKRLKNTQETSLKLNLYHNEIEEHYTITITDHKDTEITGTGQNTSTALHNLAEKITLQ